MDAWLRVQRINTVSRGGLILKTLQGRRILMQVPGTNPGAVTFYKRSIFRGAAEFFLKTPQIDRYAVYEKGTGRLWYMPTFHVRKTDYEEYYDFIKPAWQLQRVREPLDLPEVPYPDRGIVVDVTGRRLSGLMLEQCLEDEVAHA